MKSNYNKKQALSFVYPDSKPTPPVTDTLDQRIGLADTVAFSSGKYICIGLVRDKFIRNGENWLRLQVMHPKMYDNKIVERKAKHVLRCNFAASKGAGNNV